MTLRDLSYSAEDGGLSLSVEAPDLPALQRVEDGLRGAGLAVSAGVATTGDGSAEVQYRITGGRRMSGSASTWWGRRSGRERVLLAVMASGLAAYLLFVGAARPLLAARGEALATIARHEAALARLAALPEGNAPVASAEPATAIVTASAPGYDLTIRRIEAEGEGARLEIEDAGFPELVLWIEELEREHALRLITIEIERRPEPGLVGARLTLGR